MKHVKRSKNATVLIILMALCAAVFVFSLVQILRVSIPQQQEADRFNELRELVATESPDEPAASESGKAPSKQKPFTKYDKLAAENPDMVGWLKIPGTEIDYPVMQTPDDPEYYLHTGFDGGYSFSGCLFVGEGCGTESEIFVVYGHHMNNGTMFGKLDSYLDPDYLSEHPTVNFDTLREPREYRVFAALPTKAYREEEDAFKYFKAVGDPDEEGFNDTVQNLKALSVVDVGLTPRFGDQIILLSTCAYHVEDGRFVLAAYRETGAPS